MHTRVCHGELVRGVDIEMIHMYHLIAVNVELLYTIYPNVARALDLAAFSALRPSARAKKVSCIQIKEFFATFPYYANNCTCINVVFFPIDFHN